MTDLLKARLSRRAVLQTAAVGAVGLNPALRAAVHAQGSDAPEKKEVKIGFIPLTDCASVVMASVLGFDQKYGVKIIPTKEASWAGVRDKLVNSELDFAHVLYGLVYGVHLGIGGPKKDMAVLMTINHNGQGLTPVEENRRQGRGKPRASLVGLMEKEPREYTFAQTFPTGTHAMWLYYWLASAGRQPVAGRQGHRGAAAADGGQRARRRMDGFSVGEPWDHRGIMDGVSVHAACIAGRVERPSRKGAWHHRRLHQEIPQHRTRRDHGDARSRPLDRRQPGRTALKMAETIAEKSYVNTSVNVINERILGRYQNGLGKTWDDPNHMKFFNDGAVNFPYLSDGMWFLTQHKRWGLIKAHPDYLAVARQINRIDLYKQAATATRTPLPKDVMRSSKLIDGVVWDGKDPKKYADGFKVNFA